MQKNKLSDNLSRLFLIKYDIRIFFDIPIQYYVLEYDLLFKIVFLKIFFFEFSYIKIQLSGVYKSKVNDVNLACRNNRR